jgi:hypothetical protein
VRARIILRAQRAYAAMPRPLKLIVRAIALEAVPNSLVECFNCHRDLTIDQRASMPLVVKAFASLGFLIIARDFRWPADICSACARQVWIWALLSLASIGGLLWLALQNH